MLKKDKQKVFGGDWTENQLSEFLTVESYDGTDPDYLAVIRAYQHMVPETFADFIHLFKEKGHNLEAKNLKGVSLLETVQSHTQGKEYASIIEKAI